LRALEPPVLRGARGVFFACPCRFWGCWNRPLRQRHLEGRLHFRVWAGFFPARWPEQDHGHDHLYNMFRFSHCIFNAISLDVPAPPWFSRRTAPGTISFVGCILVRRHSFRSSINLIDRLQTRGPLDVIGGSKAGKELILKGIKVQSWSQPVLILTRRPRQQEHALRNQPGRRQQARQLDSPRFSDSEQKISMRHNFLTSTSASSSSGYSR
jgi:hypothetical protein